ncbi:hypothetical protein COP1_038680 [Malus domestica]
MSQPPVQKPSQASVNQVHPNKLTGTQPELGKSPAQKRLRQKPGKKPGACTSRSRLASARQAFRRRGPRAGAVSPPPPSCDVATSLPLDFQRLVF